MLKVNNVARSANIIGFIFDKRLYILSSPLLVGYDYVDNVCRK